MNKKTIIIMGIIAALLVAGFVIYTLYTKQQIDKETEKGAEAINRSIEPKNPDACADITVSSEFVSKNICYNYIAQQTNNKALCDKIEQKELKDNCYENMNKINE